MSKTRSDARTKGLRLAAKVATIGGFAVAALGFAEARAAATSTSSPAPSTNAASSVASDDTAPLPMEGWMKAGAGCGCSPCWGPPAPPARGAC